MTTLAEAVLATIRAAVPGDVAVYDSLIPGVPPARYVVVYLDNGSRSAVSVDAVSDAVHVSFQTTSVASNSNPAYSAVYCRWLAGAVQNALIDLIITVDGWAPARIIHEGSQQAQPDELTPDKKVFATDQFSLETVRIS